MANDLVPQRLAGRYIDYVGMVGEDSTIYTVPAGYRALISKIEITKFANPASGTPQVAVYLEDSGGTNIGVLLPYVPYVDRMVYGPGLVLNAGDELHASCTGTNQFLKITVSGAVQEV